MLGTAKIYIACLYLYFGLYLLRHNILIGVNASVVSPANFIGRTHFVGRRNHGGELPLRVFAGGGLGLVRFRQDPDGYSLLLFFNQDSNVVSVFR